jgi:RHS repeat-associated protein
MLGHGHPRSLWHGDEQLDNLGLVHMNGRVYNPIIGRFISADPIVQAPFNTQSLNRYSYVFNNPLSFADPSGFSGVDGNDSDDGFFFGSGRSGVVGGAAGRFRPREVNLLDGGPNPASASGPTPVDPSPGPISPNPELSMGPNLPSTVPNVDGQVVRNQGEGG